MLAGRTLDDVIAICGHDGQLSGAEREKVVKTFGIKMNPWASRMVAAFATEPYRNLAQAMREHYALWCSVYDSIDPNFAHAVVIHGNQLYDPHAGMNPTWPWSRVIGNIATVES